MSTTSPLDLAAQDELLRLRARVAELEAERAEWEQTRADLREQRQLADALRDVAATLNSTLSLAEVFDGILTQLLRLVPYDAANVILLENTPHPSKPLTARTVREYAQLQLDRESKAQGEPFAVDDLYYLKQMLITGQARVVPNTLTDARWTRQPHTQWVRSWLGAPIQIKGRVIGFLSVNSATPDFFRAAQTDRLQTLADQAAIAIENARLFEETRQRLLTLEVLYETSLALSQLLTPREIGQKIIDLVVRKLNWHHSTIRLYHPDQNSLELLAFSQPHLQSEEEARAVENRFKTLITRPGQGLSGWVIEHGQTVRSGDVSADPRYAETFPGLQSGLYVPLKIGERVLGVISVESEQADAFNEADERLTTTLAAQAAIALENALLYEQVKLYALELEERVAARTSELDHERARLQTILDTAGEAIFRVGVDGRIEFANAATTRLMGYAVDEVLGQSPLALFRSTLNAPAIIQDLDDSVRQHRSWQGELINRRKDGSVYETAVALTPIADRHGQHQGYVAVYRDITAHKELERLKSQFVSRIGHELRTPLSAIMLNLELLEYGKPERQAHYRQALTASAERLRQLIEAFFQMAKLDADLEQPDSLPVDLNRLVQDTTGEQIGRAQAQGLTLDLKIDPAAGLTPILSDPQWLRQVITIVVDNALKYTSAPGTITVSTATRTETDRAWYTITIQDTGPGLTSEDLSRLFDRFFRGSAASQYTVPGTGLNLAIAQAIMSKLGGKITVESEHGHGATFTIWVSPSA